jgi:hypothetical protein
MTMRHALPALLLLAACGGSSPPPQQPQPDAPDNTLAGADIQPAGDKAEQACASIDRLASSGCEFLQGMDNSSCVQDLREASGDDTVMALADCFIGEPTCDAARTCVDEVMVATLPPPAVLSKSPNSQAEPIEVCGVQGETAWLAVAQCDDGTNPFKGDTQVAHAARVGSVGQGGRNGNIIDLYEVTCPEATYQVYMDMYACN